MYPDDRVLVGVINRKKDFQIAEKEGWYRIPQKQMPHGINAEYIALFLSGKPFKEKSGSIAYFSRIAGFELVRRKELLPDEDKRPEEVYYKIQFQKLIDKNPPIVNQSKRSISFIRTTWDRFVSAKTIADLYSQADYYVDRIYHALKSRGVKSTPYWSTDYRTTGKPAQLRLVSDNGKEIVVSSEPQDGEINLLDNIPEDEILKEILRRIASEDGPSMIDVPIV
jgi:hypothetical protein